MTTEPVAVTTMKAIDKIAAYQRKQRDGDNADDVNESPCHLPALSLEFFPPRSQEGVLVRCNNT
jgi:hypothetical protein